LAHARVRDERLLRGLGGSELALRVRNLSFPPLVAARTFLRT
jgi:hypothetical protein